jgi:serine/threonine protein kinase
LQRFLDLVGQAAVQARAAAAIDHPHVLPVFAADERDGLVFLSMRLVEGPSLAQVLRENGRLSPQRAAYLLSQVAAGLDAAHAPGWFLNLQDDPIVAVHVKADHHTARALVATAEEKPEL